MKLYQAGWCPFCRDAVFEAPLADEAAGRTGGLAWVVGVDRVRQAGELRDRGASTVIPDLSELLEGR